MQEKQTKNYKLMLKVFAVIAGVLAIIGSIIILASVGKYTSASSSLYGSSSSDALSMLTSFTGIYAGLDIARFGAFSMFLVSVIYMVFEIFSGSAKKNSAIGMALSSVLGFVGCFLTSISALYSSVMSSATSLIGGMYGSSSDALAMQLMKKMFAPWVVGSIFILVSATAVIVMVCVTFVKPRAAFNYPAGNPYMQYPNQQYPNQQYPNQQFPNQQYPNQQYPNQQYPNQQYPNQQYPNQTYTEQGTANYPPQDQNNTPNNFQ